MAEAVLAAPAVKPKVSRDDWTMRAFIGVIGLYLVVTLAMPLYAMMSKSVRNDDGVFVGLANYIEYFATPALTWSIGNSLQVATITTLITVTVGFTFAYALTRSCIPLKGLFQSITMIPTWCRRCCRASLWSTCSAPRGSSRSCCSGTPSTAPSAS